MAASMSGLSSTSRTRRKISELEDITNSNTLQNKKMKMEATKKYIKGSERQPTPQQQRSPSPSDLSSSSPPKGRTKSVSFELSENKNYSPLLTPKDEDDFDEQEEAKRLEKATEDVVQDNSDEPQHCTEHDKPHQLDTNTDYLALTSSLRLLNNGKDSIKNEIVKLSQLLDRYSQSTDQDDIIDFYMKLLDNDLGLPKPHRIMSAPLIDWSKYHEALQSVNVDFEETTEKTQPLFKTLNIFGTK